MSEPKIIKAAWADWRPVKGRKVLQLVFEVPLEQTSEVLTMLGAPMPDKETWVAIALLEMRKFDANGNLPDAPKERRPFHELPMPQQAALKSQDVKFQLWMSRMPIGKECDSTAEAIRQWCGVTTRADIQPGTKPGERWIMLLNEFDGIR